MSFRFLYSPMIALAVVVAALPLTACHDDVEYASGTRPEIENNGEGHVSLFSLQRNHFIFPEDIDSVRIALITSQGQTLSFGAGVQQDGDDIRFRMAIPPSADIPDGKYVMTMAQPNGESIPGRLSCRFEEGLLKDVAIILPTYMLDGSGTPDDPYIIGSDDDFEMFLINLADDSESYGAGLYFSQTADVTARDQSSYIPGRGYWGAPFAGFYDGGGHKIKELYYYGNNREDSDSGFGIFSSLSGMAKVSNLSFSAVNVTGLYKDSGILAARTSGIITLENIEIQGSISGGSGIGGVIGVAESGEIHISGVRLKAHVGGTSDVGGVAGIIGHGVTATIENVTTPDNHFSVAGTDNIGGIVGTCNSDITIRDVCLDHKVTVEDSDLRIIQASGSRIGGLVGTFPYGGLDTKFYNCRIICPVGGSTADNVGGLLGWTGQNQKIYFEGCRVYSVVSGRDNVGGFIGSAAVGPQDGCVLGGDDLSNRIAVDDSEAKVEGRNCVGGFAGNWYGKLKLNSKVKINLPVSASGKDCGGVFGHVDTSVMEVGNFLIGQKASSGSTASTMKVSGGNNVGGVAGYINGTTLKGTSKFDFADGNTLRVPSPSDFTPIYECVVTGGSSVGGVVGYADNLSQLHYLSSAASVSGQEKVGGVAGTARSTVLEDCTFSGYLNCPDADCVGGIAGYLYSTGTEIVHDCVNYSTITGGDSDGGTGGIIGYAEKEKVSDEDKPGLSIVWCVNKGDVNGQRRIGGIVGRTRVDGSHSEEGNALSWCALTISDCANTGKIYGTGNDSSHAGIGGIVGFTNLATEVARCANHGEIYGEGAFHGIGGIAGSMGEDPTGTGLTNTFRNVELRESVNTGTVNAGNRSSFVGGILGYQEEGNKSDVEDCDNRGPVPASQSHDSGGIVGCVDHLTNIYRCVNSGMVSHGNATIGTHKSASTFDHGDLYFLEGTGKNWPSAKAVSKADFGKKSSFPGLFNNSETWTIGSEGPELTNCRWRNSAMSPVKF